MSKKKKKGQQQQQSRSPAPQSITSSIQASSSIMTASPSGAALLREGPEPTAGEAAVPVLLVALLGLLVYVADMHLINRGGEFNPKVYYPFFSFTDVDNARPKTGIAIIKARGKIVYKLNCEACHQATGQGSPGQFPPLAGSEWVVGEGANRTIRIILNAVTGPIDVAGNHFDSTAMLPWKATLNDQQIADVVTYIRTEWGNKASLVTPEQVKKIRDLIKDRDTPFTTDELKQVPEKD